MDKIISDFKTTGKLYEKLHAFYKGKYLCSTYQFKTQKKFKNSLLQADYKLCKKYLKTCKDKNWL